MSARRRSGSRVAGSLLALALALLPYRGLAQTVDTQTAQTARAAFDRGVTEVDAGHHAVAAVAFEESYRLRPVPVVLYNLARVYESLGRLRQARDTYERYLREGGAGVAEERRRTVEASVSRLTTEIPQLVVRATPSDARVEVDGRVERPVGGVLLLDPGNHGIVVSADGYASERRELRLDVGARIELPVQLLARTPHPIDQAQTPPTRQSPSVLTQWWFWTAVGAVTAGGVTLALGLTGAFERNETLVPGTSYDVAAIRW